MDTHTTLPAVVGRSSLIEKFASRYSIDSEKMLPILKATAFKVKDGEATNEQMAALLVVADQYKLNPFTREIFAFPDKQNGIVPVVSVDGWTRIINEHPEMNGVEFRYSEAIIKPGDSRCPGLKVAGHEWIECVIYRKDREKPVVAREYLEEVYRAPFTYKDGNTKDSAWQTHTKRFHRHKSLIQCSRLAFGFAGIFDQDEAERIVERDITNESSAAHSDPVRMPQEKKQYTAHEDATGAAQAQTGEFIPAAGERPKDNSPAAKPSQITLIRTKAEQAAITMREIADRFHLPHPSDEHPDLDTLGAITTQQGNDILAWLRDPTA